ncbi:hypothetical protein GCM10022247_36520 [Allokutzneria multivorans]|uniref:Uncharacterized protein n=1 Tax=Allokutzneria multivorans TaxID=1142134 RepID=A0ABP7SF04_9PSEU
MGWRTIGLMVENRSASEVLLALPGNPSPTGETRVGDEALSMSLDTDYALAEVGGWTVVSDPKVAVACDSDACGSLSASGGRVLTFIMDTSTTTYAFFWYVDGRHVRTAAYVEGEPAELVGEPLAEEAELPERWSEDFVPEIAHRLTGAWNENLFETSFALHRTAT